MITSSQNRFSNSAWAYLVAMVELGDLRRANKVICKCLLKYKYGRIGFIQMYKVSIKTEAQTTNISVKDYANKRTF